MINRINPNLPVNAYKTFGIDIPLGTHWREVGCEAVECEVQAQGWVTMVNEATDLGKRQAHYIRRQSGRPYTEERISGGTQFTFPPGTECFQTHRVRTDRPQIHLVRGGDWRGKVGETHIYDRPDQWQDDFATHQDKLRRAQA